MNMKRSEFVLGALSVAFLGCTKNIIAGDTKNHYHPMFEFC